jgi:hypothetical protein
MQLEGTQVMTAGAVTVTKLAARAETINQREQLRGAVLCTSHRKDLFPWCTAKAAIFALFS